MSKTFGWLDVDRIAEELAEKHAGVDPFAVRYVDLRRMIAELPGFEEEAGHPVNEKILETIQMLWSGEMKSDED